MIHALKFAHCTQPMHPTQPHLGTLPVVHGEPHHGSQRAGGGGGGGGGDGGPQTLVSTSLRHSPWR